MSWESEFETALRTALAADAALTALLASGSAIYKSRPYRQAAYPQITFSWRDEAAGDFSGYGKIELALQVDIWAAVETVDGIRDALHALLDERARIAAGKSASPITLTSWSCKHFRYLRGYEISTGLFQADAAGGELVQRVTEWNVRLYKK